MEHLKLYEEYKDDILKKHHASLYNKMSKVLTDLYNSDDYKYVINSQKDWINPLIGYRMVYTLTIDNDEMYFYVRERSKIIEFIYQLKRRNVVVDRPNDPFDEEEWAQEEDNVMDRKGINIPRSRRIHKLLKKLYNKMIDKEKNTAVDNQINTIDYMLDGL